MNLPDDCLAKIASYMPEGDGKEVFDERVLAAALQQHRERIRDRVGEIYGIQTIIGMLNDVVDGPCDWNGEPKHETSGYYKWISFEQFDWAMSSDEITRELKLKALYPKIQQFCESAPVRMQSRLVHSSHLSKGYIIGIMWPSLGITVSIEEHIVVEPGAETIISRVYSWEKTFRSGESTIQMREQADPYPETYELLLSGSKNVDLDAVVCFIETVMSIFPRGSVPNWKLVFDTPYGVTKSHLQPYAQRLWTCGIQI